MASAYRPRHKTYIKYHFTNKEKLKEITTYITKNNTYTYLLPKQLENITPALHYDNHPNHKTPQPHSQYTSHPRQRPHLRHNLHPRTKLHPKYRAHPKHRLYLKNKVHPQHKHQLKHNTHLKQETQLNLKSHPLHKFHPNPNFHPNSTPYPHTKPNLHSKYKPYKKHKMTLAYRPRHKSSLKYHITNKWKPHIIAKHIPQDNSHTCLLTRYNTHQNHKPYPQKSSLLKTKLPHSTRTLPKKQQNTHPKPAL